MLFNNGLGESAGAVERRHIQYYTRKRTPYPAAVAACQFSVIAENDNYVVILYACGFASTFYDNTSLLSGGFFFYEFNNYYKEKKKTVCCHIL